MMELLKSWVLGLTGAALLSGVVLALTPKGRWSLVLRLVCGFLLLTVLIGPVLRLDIEGLSQAIVQYKVNLGSYGDELETENRRLLAELIEREAAEYILDKAAEIGVQLEEVTVTTRLDQGDYPYPYAAVVKGTADAEAQARLAEWIEAELGIAKERLTWN